MFPRHYDVAFMKYSDPVTVPGSPFYSDWGTPRNGSVVESRGYPVECPRDVMCDAKGVAYVVNRQNAKIMCMTINGMTYACSGGAWGIYGSSRQQI